MNIRLLAALLLIGTAATLTTAQQPASPIEPRARKERVNQAGTPGVLRPLRRTPSTPTFTIDTDGITLPDDGTAIDPSNGARYRRGELLVRFEPGASTAARAQALRAGRATGILRTLAKDWELVALDPATSAEQAADALRGSEGVRDVVLNYVMTAQQFRPNDENYSLQWNFPLINLPSAWQINPGGRDDVVVAVIDSGLNTVNDTIVFFSPVLGQVPATFSTVPDLVTAGRITNPRDFIFDDDVPVDLEGHGTHVAGTIAQLTNNNIGVAGVAFNVKLMPLKVLSADWEDILVPSNPGGSTGLVAEAIRYAADNNAKVINLSLGGEGSAPTVRDAIQYAVEKGAFVAIAAGNSAEDGNPTEYPAAYGGEINGAMTVGAVNRSLRRADYSGFHSYVEICAPGGELLTSVFDYDNGVTQVGYDVDEILDFRPPIVKLAALRSGFRPRFDRFELRPFQGTSMATPHISGVAALLYSQGIRSPSAIEEAIKKFARPLGLPAEECGAGLVDARRALRGLGLGR
jgi:serine protease